MHGNENRNDKQKIERVGSGLDFLIGSFKPEHKVTYTCAKPRGKTMAERKNQ